MAQPIGPLNNGLACGGFGVLCCRLLAPRNLALLEGRLLARLEPLADKQASRSLAHVEELLGCASRRVALLERRAHTRLLPCKEASVRFGPRTHLELGMVDSHLGSHGAALVEHDLALVLDALTG